MEDSPVSTLPSSSSSAEPERSISSPESKPVQLKKTMRPPYSPDTEFFWQGAAIGELRIQRCGACGALRHPPGPACLSCGATEKQEYQVAAGTGRQVPGDRLIGDVVRRLRARLCREGRRARAPVNEDVAVADTGIELQAALPHRTAQGLAKPQSMPL